MVGIRKINKNKDYINFILYVYKYAKLLVFFNDLNNLQFKLKLLIFFKKKSSLLTSKKNYRSSIFHKSMIFTRKKKIIKRPKFKRSFFRENQYSINFKLLKVLYTNRRVFKVFFLKNFSRQKKITRLLQHFSKKKQNINKAFNSYLSFVLIRSHFFFFLEDVNFFLKKNFILVNGSIEKNKFFELRAGDCIQLVNSDGYYDYIFSIYKFFKKKMRKMKYNRWKSIQRKKTTGAFIKHWLPNFLNRFSFYRSEIPKFLEVDFFSLTVIYLYKTSNVLQHDLLLVKIFSSYLLKMYNWGIK